MSDDVSGISGEVTWELRGPDGELKRTGTAHNLITNVGDQVYAERGAGIMTLPAPTGMRLGSGSTAVAKSGAGAALVTLVANSNQAIDGGYPTSAAGGGGNGRTITYRVTYAAGKATTAGAINEAVIVNDSIAADVATAAAGTIARVLLTGIGSKGASDTLTVTWTHTLTGA